MTGFGPRITETVVTIVGTNVDTGAIMCRDSFGNEFEINGSVRRKGVGIPQPGERWLLAKVGGNLWVPDIQIGAPMPATITGSREGLHPVLSQMLDTLAEQGMIYDETTPALEIISADPVPPPDPAEVADWGGDGDYGSDDFEDDPGVVVPGDDNGPPPVVAPAKKTGWVPIYMASMNTYKTLGPATALQDLVRLSQTRVQIIGTQEAHSNARDSGFNHMQDLGWSVYRPKTGAFSDENTILWRTNQFKRLDQGSIFLGHHTQPDFHEPPRYLNWVKLLHYDTGRPLFFMDTHYDHHIEKGGHPRTEAFVQQTVALAFQMIQTTAYWMQRFGAIAPVFTAGDFNIDYVADARERTGRFPVRVFGSANTYSNWDLIKARPRYGTAGNRYIDQVWATRPTYWHVKAVDQWILTGYKSDHRPALVRFDMLSKN